jgi:acetyl esterase/lipase
MLFAARHGMVGVNVEYRLAPQFPWPAGNEDLAAAVQLVAAKASELGADPNRIYLMGHSAGATHVARTCRRISSAAAARTLPRR